MIPIHDVLRQKPSEMATALRQRKKADVESVPEPVAENDTKKLAAPQVSLTWHGLPMG